MEELIQKLGIDIPILIIYILGGLFAKKYIKIKGVSTTYTTLIVGSLLTIAYVIAMYLENNILPFTKIIMSYALATSFYELILKQILKKIGMNDEKGTYECAELTQTEFDNLTDVQAGDMVFMNGVLKVANLTPSHDGIEWVDNYIGSRPPHKPVRV